MTHEHHTRRHRIHQLASSLAAVIFITGALAAAMWAIGWLVMLCGLLRMGL